MIRVEDNLIIILLDFFGCWVPVVLKSLSIVKGMLDFRLCLICVGASFGELYCS